MRKTTGCVLTDCQKQTRPAPTPPPDISLPPPVAAPMNTCGSQNSPYPGPIPGTINPLHALLNNPYVMLSPWFNQLQNAMVNPQTPWFPRQPGQMNL